MCFMKNAVRIGVLTALVGGAAALVVGPDRMGALFDQTQSKINKKIDKCIEDPVALRAQMRTLESEYPDRLAELRGDLAELKQQKQQLVRDREVSARVVELAESDMTTIAGLIERGEQAQTTAQAMYDPSDPNAGSPSTVRVVFNNQSIPLKDAYAKATRIQQTHTAYVSRATDIDRDMGYLEQQEQRLTEMVGQLETEYTEFQAQVWQMDRQVDSISRNDRLIAVMEKRQKTLDEQGRYKAHSLDQLAGRFADIRVRQEAKLEGLAGSSSGTSYEDRAKFDIDARKPLELKGRGLVNASKAPAAVIEITPADLKKPSLRPAEGTATSPAPKTTASANTASSADQSLALKR